MNERILELARQVWPDPNISHVNHMKFAELIVRECGVALSPMLRDMVSRGQAFDLIKQHFGVE
jgi:hypothetical protein